MVHAQLLLSVPDVRTSSADEHFEVGGRRPGVNGTCFSSFLGRSEGTHGDTAHTDDFFGVFSGAWVTTKPPS